MFYEVLMEKRAKDYHWTPASEYNKARTKPRAAIKNPRKAAQELYEKLAEAKEKRKSDSLSTKQKLGVGAGALAGAIGTTGNITLPSILKGKLSDAQIDARMSRYGKLVPAGMLAGGVAGGLLARKGIKAYKARGDRREREGKDRLSKKERLGLAAGQLYVGKGMLDAGAERVLGAQRFSHGTSKANAKSILSGGLLSSHGGKAAGSTAQLGDTGKTTAKKIKGKIHIFRDQPLSRRLARGHANLAEKGGLGAHIKGVFGVPSVGGGGKILHGEMKYDDLRKNYRIDPDYGSLSGAVVSRKGAKADIPASQIKKTRGGLRRIFAARADDIPAYLKKYKGRALRGGALLGGAAFLGSKAYRNIKQSRDQKD